MLLSIPHLVELLLNTVGYAGVYNIMLVTNEAIYLIYLDICWLVQDKLVARSICTNQRN